LPLLIEVQRETIDPIEHLIEHEQVKRAHQTVRLRPILRPGLHQIQQGRGQFDQINAPVCFVGLKVAAFEGGEALEFNGVSQLLK
jgi:hypothetical protein